MKRFYRFFDKYKAIFFVFVLVLSGGLIFGTMIASYFSTKIDGLTASYEERLHVSQEQINSLTAHIAGLTNIIDSRLPKIVEQQEQATEQMTDLVGQVEQAADKSKRAAVTASKAAGHASTAADHVRKNVPMQPLKPIKKTPTTGVKCVAGRDVYGDRCE